jgi:hypothetical protein
MNDRPITPGPLQDQPFSRVPELAQPGSELKTNVSETERVACGVAGLFLLATGGHRDFSSDCLSILLGAALIMRGLTGYCPVYYYAGIDTRH